MVACFAAPGVQVCLLHIKSFLLPTHERRQSRRPYRKKQSLKHHICSKIMVVGYPKMIKCRGGHLLCRRWCSSINLIHYRPPPLRQKIGKVRGISYSFRKISRKSPQKLAPEAGLHIKENFAVLLLKKAQKMLLCV